MSYGEHHVKIKRWKGKQSSGVGISYGKNDVKIKRWKGRQSPGVEISYGEHHVKIQRWKGRHSPGVEISYGELHVFYQFDFFLWFLIWLSFGKHCDLNGNGAKKNTYRNEFY